MKIGTRSILVVIPAILAANVIVLGTMTYLDRHSGVEQVVTKTTFVDPNVARRAEARQRDTRELHARSCKEDPRGYDCLHSGPQ